VLPFILTNPLPQQVYSFNSFPGTNFLQGNGGEKQKRGLPLSNYFI
jgi:hypothetical protein